ncbi:DUF421 domain-containing protein [Clostridium sp. MB40-C1]|uniref:DUF421 domain-containing protein n=1 Tax=Clostridium sp. MB40-C1 TaxID=3070996 RepID=UPI0027DEC070|nr:DUF421 domain-containing protein [Clostridium sp. MB40-C1]WMJ80728.1 DUF421 domain-containing protein [Clostridium sp. MB40-C1]
MNEALVVAVRAIISFFTLLIFTRVMGKQQIGQITFFDYILGITIGSLAAPLTSDLNSAAWPHWIGLLVWIVLGILMQIVSMKSEKISEYINDEPIIIIYDGKVIAQNLKDSKFTFDELLEQLRLKDIFDVNEVKLAVIETNGQVSVFKKEQFQNLIYSMNIPLNTDKSNDSNYEVIFNGIIIDSNLTKLNLSRQWLLNKLKEQGFDNPVEVFFAYLDVSRKLQINAYRDNIISSKNIFK